MASRSLVVVAAVLGLLASSCVSMKVPERFLVTREGPAQLKAITPDQTKLWVREFEDPDKGDLAFWSEALKRHLSESRGYTILSEGKIEDGDGHVGVEYLLEATVQGRTMRELLALFVHEGFFQNRIRVVELVGEKAAFDAVVEDVRASIQTLR